MTTVSVLAEVVNDESMVFPTGIPVDIPMVLCSSGQYLVWYSTEEMEDKKNVSWKTLKLLRSTVFTWVGHLGHCRCLQRTMQLTIMGYDNDQKLVLDDIRFT